MQINAMLLSLGTFFIYYYFAYFIWSFGFIDFNLLPLFTFYIILYRIILHPRSGSSLRFGTLFFYKNKKRNGKANFVSF